jgi:integrase
MRHRNEGLRKLCGCSRKRWSECSHSWYFNFKWKGQHYRFSLDKELGRDIDSKSLAETEAEKIRTAIRENRFRSDAPVRETLTLGAMIDRYRTQHIIVHRPTTLKTLDYMIADIKGTILQRADGEKRYFGAWLVADITTDVIEQYRQARLPAGSTGTNRHLELLRSLFNWAASSKRKLVADNPFRDGDSAAIKLQREDARRRRLQPGEGERLLAACGPHLRAVVEAALETGMRKGEILGLQWSQIQQEPRPQIYLPAVKTKTRRDRWIPISSRLQKILDMRRTSPDGEDHPGDAYVFGNECGEPVQNVKRAWERAVLVAHGYKPEYVKREIGEGKKPIKTAALTAASRAQLRTIDLHLHDLRREAGSRWLEGGVPIHVVRDWLGHTNVSQTSEYLAGTINTQHDAMKRYEEQLQKLATAPGKRIRKRARTATMRDNSPRMSSEKHH